MADKKNCLLVAMIPEGANCGTAGVIVLLRCIFRHYSQHRQCELLVTTLLANANVSAAGVLLLFTTLLTGADCGVASNGVLLKLGRKQISY